MIGGEGSTGANQNRECVRDNQWDQSEALSLFEKAGGTGACMI